MDIHVKGKYVEAFDSGTTSRRTILFDHQA
jgi:glycerol kinase